MSTLTQDNIARFDALARQWDDDPRRVATAQAIAAAIVKMSAPHADECAFEFGCGTGLLSLALARELGQIVAMDSSAQMLNVLEKKANALGLMNIQTLEGSVPEHRPDVTGQTPTLLPVQSISDRIGLSAKRVFHSRGVSSATRLAGWMATR